MRLHEALEFISRGDAPRGYRVHFEERSGGMLRSGHFPDRDENPFATEREAIAMMELFASRAPARFVNIYLIDEKWSPVGDYETRTVMRKHP